jgi:hypothetical protein
MTAKCEHIAYKIWEPKRLTTSWAYMDSYRDSFLSFFVNMEGRKVY